MSQEITTLLFTAIIIIIFILIHVIRIYCLPNIDNHINELFKKYGELVNVKVIQYWNNGLITPRGGRMYNFFVELSLNDKHFSYKIASNDSYAGKYLGLDNFNVLILREYFEWEMGNIAIDELENKYSSEKIKFKINNDLTFPKMIFPERLEIYNRKEEKQQLRKMKRKQK